MRCAVYILIDVICFFLSLLFDIIANYARLCRHRRRDTATSMGTVPAECRERRIELGGGDIDSEGRGVERQGVGGTGAQREPQRDTDQIRRVVANVRREGRGESGIATGPRGYQGDVQNADRSAVKETKLKLTETRGAKDVREYRLFINAKPI